MNEYGGDFCFEDMMWLFTCDNRNRGLIRQNFDEAALLWKSARKTKGPILEIGRSRAGSTSLLAAAAGGREVYSIDIAPRHEKQCLAFLDRHEFKGQIRLITGDSRNPVPGVSFGFLFIDGDHTFEGVLADVMAHWNTLDHSQDAPLLCAFHDAIPNEGFFYREKARKKQHIFKRLKSKFRNPAKSVTPFNYCPGVYTVCQHLISTGLAEEHDRAGSLWVIEKKKDLTADFEATCQNAWCRIAGITHS